MVTNTDTTATVLLRAGSPDLLNGQTPQSIADRGYAIRDDELARFLMVRHDWSLLEEKLREVYIRVEPHDGELDEVLDEVNPSPLREFRRLIDPSRWLSEARSRDTASSGPFWVVPVVLAFEGQQEPQKASRSARDQERLDTHDPTTPTGFAMYSGSTVAPLGQPTSFSYVENIRDAKETSGSPYRPTMSLGELLRSNLAHEVLHALTLHHNGGIMCATRKNYAQDADRYLVTPLQRATLRGVPGPGVAPNVNVACGTPGAPLPPDCCPLVPPTAP